VRTSVQVLVGETPGRVSQVWPGRSRWRSTA